jgi:hypothetical protein
MARSEPRRAVAMSGRPEDRPVPPTVRASARKRADRDDGTNDGGTVPRAMSEEDREAARRAGAEDARRSRIEQGLPERIEDPVAIAQLTDLFGD